MDVISFERVRADYHNYWDGGGRTLRCADSKMRYRD